MRFLITFARGSHKVSATCATVSLMLALAFPAAGVAQTPGSLQIPYAATAIGIPAGSTNTVCSASIGDEGTTVGGEPGYIGDGCPPNQAVLSGPTSTAIDSLGNLYFTDLNHYAVRVLYQGGTALQTFIVDAYNKKTVITAASLVPGDVYQFCGPYVGALGGQQDGGHACGDFNVKGDGIALDPVGNAYVIDGGSYLQLEYVGGTAAASLLSLTQALAEGKETATAGFGYAMSFSTRSGYYGDGLNAFQALMNSPRGLAVDANENIYIADTLSNAIRMINGKTGIISTIAGAGCVLATGVLPYDTASGTNYIETETTPGGCTPGNTGNGGPALSAELNNPWDVMLDPNGNLYIADYKNGLVRVLYGGQGTIPGVTNPVTGSLYTVAGGGTLTSGGPATQILLQSAGGLGMDAQGNLYIADTVGARIWEVDSATQVATIIAGGGTSTKTGAACSANFPTGPVAQDNLGDGCLGTLAYLVSPQGHMSFDSFGNLYVADMGANVIRKFVKEVPAAPTTSVGATSNLALAFAPLTPVTAAGDSIVLQGVGSGDFTDAGGSTCTGPLAAGVACSINVAFTPSMPGLRAGGVSVMTTQGTVFGTNYVSGVANGAAIALDSGTQTSTGTGLSPSSAVADPNGAVYVADTTSGNLYKYPSVTATSPSATLMSGLSSPGQISVDGLGNVFAADKGNNRIAIYNAGTNKVSYLTGYNAPQGVAVDGSGNIYVAATGSNQIIQINLAGNSKVLTTSVVAPTQLSFDGAGNLYIIDSGNSRVVELPGGTGTQASIPVGSFVPIAVNVDAANDIYVLDKASSQVAFISAQGATTVTLLGSLASPSGLSVDAFGNIYVADAKQGVIGLGRQKISTTFFPLNVGQTSTFDSFVLTNIGNAQLTFSGSSAFAASGNATQFTVTPASSNGCTGSPLSPGAGCDISSVFAPVALGNFADALTFPSNAANVSRVSSTLKGSGVNLLNSNLAITSSPSASMQIGYGAPLTVNFALSQSGTTAATGMILVQVNGIPLTTLTVKNSLATYVFTPQAGTYQVAGVYSGDANYASSNAALTITIVPGVTTTKLTYTGAPLSVLVGQTPAYTLTANVTSAAAVNGVVAFYAGTTVLGMASLNNAGVATLSLLSTNAAAFALNQPVFSAGYLGGANFAPSTSNKITVSGDFGLQALATTLQEPAGVAGTTTLTVTPYFGLAGNMTFACSNLPANTICDFLPEILSLPGGLTETATSTQLQVYTSVPQNLAWSNPTRNPVNWKLNRSDGLALTAYAGLLFAAWRRRRVPLARKLLLLLLSVGMPAVAGLGLTGCANGYYYSLPTVSTPQGTTTFTVTATSASGAAESVQIVMVVGPPPS